MNKFIAFVKDFEENIKRQGDLFKIIINQTFSNF
jgi:hypothetical protein